MEENSSNKSLYDALSEVLYELDCEHNLNLENEFEKYAVENIEIIGIGTGTDNCSNTDKQQAMLNFKRAIKMYNINTKYCCLYEENIVDVAELGFRSIAVMFK